MIKEVRIVAEVKWIKLVTDLFDNRKIKQIEVLPEGDAIIVIWMKLLCLAGNINDSGYVYFTNEIPYTDQMLSTQFNRPLTTIQLALKTFEQFGMIEIIDDMLRISNWEKYQSVDKMAEIREYNRLAKQRSREKQKLLNDVNDMSMTSQPCQGTDIDIDIEEDIDIDIDTNNNTKGKTKRKRFVKPTVEDIRAYCVERNNNVNPERFYNYYESNGWMVGKNKMKNWKAAVLTWEDNQKKGNYTYKPQQTTISNDLDPQITAQLRALEEQQMASLPDVANMSDEDIDRLIRGEL